jgi:vacuolar protein sorting-associated protein 13A/C
VRRCFAYLTTSLWSYHQSLEVWEPILEPWQLLLHMDTNPNPAASAGIAPGTWVKVTSPHGCMHVTLAQAALNYALDALADWQDLAAGGDASSAAAKRRQGLAATDGLTVYTTVLNTLGTAAYMQLDYGGGRKEVVALAPHATTPLRKPIPVPAASHAPLTDGQPPPMRLVVDVLQGQLLAGLGGASWAPELFVQVGLRRLGLPAMPTHVCVWHVLAGAGATGQVAVICGNKNVAACFKEEIGICWVAV